jgi:putative Mn2+ efflux pump MntP
MITIFLIAVGLAMDAFAVSISSGITIRDPKVSTALTIALFFGAFQAFMPVIGWFGGLAARAFITGIDHWIAFGLLCMIGCKMIADAINHGRENKKLDPTNLSVLALLAFATSIDALAVGLSLSFLQMAILIPALIIGLVTFGLSFLGVFVGNLSGNLFEHKVEIIGGLILIGIGIKIVLDHTLPV